MIAADHFPMLFSTNLTELDATLLFNVGSQSGCHCAKRGAMTIINAKINHYELEK